MKKKSKKNQKKTINVDNKIIKINDILVSSWGYEQIHSDFHQVIGIKGKRTVLLRELRQDKAPTNFIHGLTIPVLNEFINDEILVYKFKLSCNSEFSKVIRISTVICKDCGHEGKKEYYYNNKKVLSICDACCYL